IRFRPKEFPMRGLGGLAMPASPSGRVALPLPNPSPARDSPPWHPHPVARGTSLSFADRRHLRILGFAAALRVTLAALRILAPRFRSPPPRIAVVTRGEVAQALVLTGRVRTLERPRIGANIPGTIREVLVREGDRVRPGQLLARLQDAEALAGVAQARAALILARARAGAGEEQAEQAVGQAERDLERLRSLYAVGAVATREVEVAERELADARSALEAARARGGHSSPLAEVAAARATLAAAEARLADTRVTAPTAGVVLTRSVEPGGAVTPGQVLFELALDGPTELSVDAREENLASLAPGAAAIASADAFPDSVFPARVLSLSPMVDPAQGTVEVRFTVPTPPAYLR